VVEELTHRKAKGSEFARKKQGRLNKSREVLAPSWAETREEEEKHTEKAQARHRARSGGMALRAHPVDRE